jgi:hypothetical protein
MALAAQASYIQALNSLESLTKNLTSTQEQLAKKQKETTALQANLALAKTSQDRAKLQAQIRSAQTTVSTLQTTIQRLQASIVTAKADVQKKKAALDALQQQQQQQQTFKRALLVGINYKDSPYELHGCMNDVHNMRTQLQTYFPNLKDITLLSDDTTKPSKANVLAAINKLVTGLKSGENIMFHYSGHGGLLRDKNGDEVSGYDSCIYPYANGIIDTITDDELRSALATRIPQGCKCFVVLDACNSGTAVDLRYLWATTPSGSLSYKEDPKYAKTVGDILFLSACKDNQYAIDTVDATGTPNGALTWALLETWRTYGPAIKTKYLLWDVQNFLKTRGYDQIPQLSTGNYMDLQTVFRLG